MPACPFALGSRACEKVVLAPDGSAAGERICDIVRDMFECKSMDDVAMVLHLIAACKDIEIVRFKDRFAEPSAGWRDAMVNYRVKGSHHVCEVQICHQQLLVCRKQLGGHESYAQERNAREVLEFLGVPPAPKKGGCCVIA